MQAVCCFYADLYRLPYPRQQFREVVFEHEVAVVCDACFVVCFATQSFDECCQKLVLERVPGSYRQVSVFDASPAVSSVSRGEGALRAKGGIKREVPLRTCLPDCAHILL